MKSVNQGVSIHINIAIDPKTLTTIVAKAKEKSGPDAKGVYRVDTADAVSLLITKFLAQKDFQAFADDIDNY